ncbi:transposase [Arsenicibacter rosenii]|uniref:Transposase IS200-like domain-containing protein n=1 Tax=Arsenicibacter rosenii TaxID=1750698 RepID=A0A1S2VIB7_9BACT|nr:hypothetical protein BLX24_17920 [Arsenicibacter rosenii]
MRKVRQAFGGHVSILAYCLMPNHFHFLIRTEDEFRCNDFLNSYRLLLSSYTRAINKQEGRTGSLFQQNSKAKLLGGSDYAFTCFCYIHQNPLRAGLVNQLHEWEFSSFMDYVGIRGGTLCNKELCRSIIEISEEPDTFIKESYLAIPDEVVRDIFIKS